MNLIEQPAVTTDADDDFESFLRLETRRRRRTFAIAGGAVAVLVAAVVVFVVTRASHPDIDRDLAGKIRAAIPHIHGESQSAFAAEALWELEAKRLPAPMLKALKNAANGGPYGAMSLAEALADPAVVPIWKRACPGGPRVLADAMQTGGASAICDECPRACSKLGAISGHPVAVAFAVLAADALSEHGRLHSVEVELLQMLAN
jgi:hypothetical protein